MIRIFEGSCPILSLRTKETLLLNNHIKHVSSFIISYCKKKKEKKNSIMEDFSNINFNYLINFLFNINFLLRKS